MPEPCVISFTRFRLAASRRRRRTQAGAFGLPLNRNYCEHSNTKCQALFGFDSAQPSDTLTASLCEVSSMRRALAVLVFFISSAARTEEPAAEWAYQPLRRPAPPAVQRKDAIHNPIDAFLLAELEKKHLAFAAPADRRTLIRRVSFDLMCFPPAAGEIRPFL